MKVRTTLALCMIGFCASATVAAQGRGGPAFTATGTSCSDVTWSQETLRQYPRIASACQEVLQRDGKYFVRFEGEVQRVANRGQQLTIDFRDGDTLTVTPPENLSLTINGRRTAVRDLRPGDDLRFYVPQDQLAVNFFEDQQPTAPPQVAQITPPSQAAPPPGALAQNQPPRQGVLPRTAGFLPLGAVAGAIFVLLGVALTVHRRTSRRR